MNQFIEIFTIGIVVLIVAIIVNMLATWVGFTTWYGFFNTIATHGFEQAVRMVNIQFVFLILIYPFILGAAAYYTHALLSSL